MKEEDFIKLILKRNSLTISENALEGSSAYREIAGITEYIDYGCKITFDNDRCSHGENINAMCCCRGCDTSIGYRTSIRQSEIPILAEYFDVKTGYWRKDKGCILPRKYRSEVCLVHKCVRLGILSTIVLGMLRQLKNTPYTILSPHDFIWKDFIKALKKENKYIKPKKSK